MTTILRKFLIVLTLSLSACAATQSPPDDTDLRLQAANHYFGGRYEYLVIHSRGQFSDAMLMHTARATGPSEIAMNLATQLARAQKSRLRIMVSGVDARRTLDVIRDAFAVHANTRLPGLEFLFLGEPKDEGTVRRLVESAGGVLHFAPFES